MRRLFITIWPPLPVWRRLDLGVLSVLLYTLTAEIAADVWEFEPAPWLSELGIVNAVLLGVLLGFRNKEAYERWWEARKLWGQLINDSRNFALKAKAYAELTTSERTQTATAIYHFALSLKYHLRGKKYGSPRPEFARPDREHLPADLSLQCFDLLKDWRGQNKITEYELLLIDPHARALMDICGACERIQNTPVPLSYRSLLRHGTVIYLLSVPWFLAGEAGYWGVVIVGVIAYFLLGTELTAESIEDPFGLDGDDLQLGKYCETIRVSVQEILEVDVPMPLRA